MADDLSIVQEQLNLICQQFYNFLGILQRDAPPMSLTSNTEKIDNQSSFDIEKETSSMADSVVESFRSMEAGISKLPYCGEDADTQNERIMQLQIRDAELGGLLAERVETCEGLLKDVQGLYAVLVQHKLQQMSQEQLAKTAKPPAPST